VEDANVRGAGFGLPRVPFKCLMIGSIDAHDTTAAPRRVRLARSCYRIGALPALQALRRVWRDDLRILAYHRVLDIDDLSRFKFDLAVVSASSAQFREQLDWIRRRFHPVTFREVIAALDGGPPLPADAMLITFDDGYEDNYRIAFPILREFGMSATFFVSTGHIDSGRPYAYDWLVYMICTAAADRLSIPELRVEQRLPASLVERRRIAEHVLEAVKRADDATQRAVIAKLERDWNLPRSPHPDCRPMTWDALAEMQDAGMEIGSHGVHHRMLAKLADDELEHELVASKAALDARLGRPAEVISYPVGGADAYDARVMDAAARAGYRAACSYVGGTNVRGAMSRYALNRLAVERDMDKAWFAAMVAVPEVFGYPSGPER
jgi:peptidoglycan/xylan/chitin deacetylase (PgdA/CDA1 family)